ncbi:unnamed protein product [Ostreobium quekettii]|uniref:Uncharacterized protein n=1 Tax=Ostreobium quekettii TaxID=121088 RepID=A0A8S1JG09_9CHLO|nr:unnamed protein product [Ostreobium quekettii]|eukprot:evm.model.scf_2292.1 EVM.evm.TU.scf_2292.1   scf_2292:15939-18559(-)
MECSNSTEDASETSGSFAIDPGCYHFGTCLAHECESRTQQFPLVLQCGLVRRSLPLPIEPGWIFLDRCAAPHLFIRSNAWCQNESCSDHIGAVRFTYAGRYCFSFETANRTPTTERHSLVMLLYIVMSVVLGWIGVALCQKVRMLRGVHRAPAQLGAAQIAVVPQQQQRVVKESGPLPILVEDPEGHMQFGLQCGAPGGDGNRSRDIEMQLLPLTTGPDSSLGSPTLADHTPGASTSQGES